MNTHQITELFHWIEVETVTVCSTAVFVVTVVMATWREIRSIIRRKEK